MLTIPSSMEIYQKKTKQKHDWTFAKSGIVLCLVDERKFYSGGCSIVRAIEKPCFVCSLSFQCTACNRHYVVVASMYRRKGSLPVVLTTTLASDLQTQQEGADPNAFICFPLIVVAIEIQCLTRRKCNPTHVCCWCFCGIENISSFLISMFIVCLAAMCWCC